MRPSPPGLAGVHLTMTTIGDDLYVAGPCRSVLGFQEASFRQGGWVTYSIGSSTRGFVIGVVCGKQREGLIWMIGAFTIFALGGI